MKKKSNTGRPLGGYSITIMDWQKMHPFPGKVYDSDSYYHKIANKVAAILESKGFAFAYSKEDVKFMALNLTAYFEDVISELFIFVTFVEEYRKNFDREFPWYKIEEEYLLDEVNLVDVRFILWLSMFACRDGSVPNPENPGMLEASEEIYVLFIEEFEEAPVNRELGDDIYDEGVLEPGKLKTILMWLSSSCYLMPLMYPVQRELKRYLDEIHSVFSPTKPNAALRRYMDDSYKCVSHTCGPLAWYPKDWYAKMREKLYIFKGTKEIQQVKASPVYPFAIVKDNGKTFTMRSCRGVEYEVDKVSFSQSELKMLRVGDVVVTMLFYYLGLWHICGLAYNAYIHDLDKALKDLEGMAEGFVDHMGRKVDITGKPDLEIPGNTMFGKPYDAERCKKAIEENKGSHLFYFKKIADAIDWVDNNLFDSKEKSVRPKDQYPRNNEPVVVFITEDNNVMMSSAAVAIHDPANPYYKSDSDAVLFTIMLDPEQLPNPMCKYLVDHNFTDRFGLQSLHGKEYGRKLMQDNIRFFLTLTRQYQF